MQAPATGLCANWPWCVVIDCAWFASWIATILQEFINEGNGFGIALDFRQVAGGITTHVAGLKIHALVEGYLQHFVPAGLGGAMCHVLAVGGTILNVGAGIEQKLYHLG